ncbi:MAG TPA: ABC transporter ATP-binding protein, partial [Albitalea sp.]|nr:ABC transporter ATP-binding protein [Albitalea sp.]
MSYLQLKGVEKVFGDVRVIKGVDLKIEKGEFVVFVGPSGCGK